MRLNRVYALAVLSLFALPGRAAGPQLSPTGKIQSAYATTSSGVRIQYLQSGLDTSPRALVLIPGWRLPAFLFKEQLARFSSSIRVIAIDPRSQARSTKTSDGNTPEIRARDLRDVLAALGVSRSILVGWSQGAQDVAAYLQQFGTVSVEGVVFVDTAVTAGPAEIEIDREFSRIILGNISVYASHPKEESEGMVRSLFKKSHPELDMQSIVDSTLQTPVDTGIAMLVADIFGADRRAVLTTLDRPALIIGSAESPLIDAQKRMADAIPRSKFVLVGGAGHAVFIDAPEKFDEALGSFLQSLPR